MLVTKASPPLQISKDVTIMVFPIPDMIFPGPVYLHRNVFLRYLYIHTYTRTYIYIYI